MLMELYGLVKPKIFKESKMEYARVIAGLEVSVKTVSEGLNWYYVAPSGLSLSVICHSGSYGRQEGKFEVLPSWTDKVVGWLNFGEVDEYITELIKMDRKAKAQAKLK